MDDGRLDELAALDQVATASSSRSSSAAIGQSYEIVAGERRWRASQRAGLLKVPVVVRDIPDDRLLAAALIENIQREDLNPIEEALAYRRLTDDLHLTQEQIAESVGKDRSSIANYLRLLKLPNEVRESVASSTLSMGHARALAGITDEAQLLAPGARRHRQATLGARDRSADSKSRRTPRQRRKPPRKTSTPAPPKTNSASPSAPASASSAKARAAGSRSTSRPRTNCRRLYELLVAQ